LYSLYTLHDIVGILWAKFTKEGSSEEKVLYVIFDYKSYVKILPDHVLQHYLVSLFELAKFPRKSPLLLTC